MLHNVIVHAKDVHIRTYVAIAVIYQLSGHITIQGKYVLINLLALKTTCVCCVDGLNGSDGASGAMGSAGVPGRTGSPGENGTPGRRGFPGQRGLVGPSGPPGRDGADGRNGTEGLQGEEVRRYLT